MKRSRLNPISKKRQLQLSKYNKLIVELREGCDNKSELSGNSPDWQSEYIVEPHHILGRYGELLLDPLNIIMLTRTEHDIEEGKVKGEKVGREKLLALVRELRNGKE